MGRSWIQGYKNIQAAKKGNLYTKFSKEISVAARMGGPDPDGNARLRAAIEEARHNSMPREIIERAIKKGAGLIEGAAYEDIMYEGYGPHGVAVMIECLTDNRNRTVSELKVLFRDGGGNMGEMGSVNWMFTRVGIVEGTHEKKPADLEGEAIEAGAQNVSDLGEGGASFTTDAADVDSVRGALTQRGWKVTLAELGYEAKNQVTLGDEEKKVVIGFLQELNGHDDVRRVHAALA